MEGFLFSNLVKTMEIFVKMGQNLSENRFKQLRFSC